MSFGQGMMTTMVQVASAFSSTINGGTYYRPTLVYGTENSDGTIKEQAPTVVQNNVVSAQTSTEMRDLVWHTRYDNSVNRAVDPAGYYIGGKTGTAQTIDPNTGKYSDDLTIGSYLGFVGGSSSSTPNYVIMIRMDFAQGGTFVGSIEANHMFGEMARWLINYDGMAPN
jgi:cell division protein FtsI/penicillin-binding protein 2